MAWSLRAGLSYFSRAGEGTILDHGHIWVHDPISALATLRNLKTLRPNTYLHDISESLSQSVNQSINTYLQEVSKYQNDQNVTLKKQLHATTPKQKH